MVSEVVCVGVGSLVWLYLLWGLTILSLIWGYRVISKPLRKKKKRIVHLEIDGWTIRQEWDAELYRKYHPTLKRDSISYPDDPDHPFALIRAWDRHLIRRGMLPLNPEGCLKIVVGGKEYLEYGKDEQGHLIIRRKAVRTPRL